MKYYTSTTEYNCGIDLHARQMYVCLMDRQGKKLLHTNTLNNDSLWAYCCALLDRLAGPPSRWAMARLEGPVRFRVKGTCFTLARLSPNRCLVGGPTLTVVHRCGPAAAPEPFN